MDSSGNLVNSYVYDLFGNLFEQNETVANPWQYASGYLDSATGLYHFGARYYDPTLGRWTQQDPVAPTLTSPDSLNRYLYVGDSPVNGTDTSGRDFWSCFWFVLDIAGIGLLLIGGIIGIIAAAVFTPPPFDFFAAIGASAIVIASLIFAIQATVQEAKACLQ